MKHRTARFRVAREHVAAAREAIATFVAGITAHEPGTLRYESFVEPDGVTFLHVMTFVDDAAEAAHRATPHVAAFVARLYPLCEVRPEFVELSAVAHSAAR